MAEAWYVARIKTTISWDVIIHNLRRQEFQSYLPIVRHTSYFAGKKTIVEQPLFPTYIFILLDLDVMRWRAVNSTIGIIHILPIHAEVPHSVPTEFVDKLKTKQTSEQLVATVQQFLANDIVRFVAGPLLASLPDGGIRTGKVLSGNAKSTRLAVDVLGRDTVITVPTAALALVGGPG